MNSVFARASIAAPFTYAAATRFVRGNGGYCGSFESVADGDNIR
jgi:hypothetical protein